MDILLNAKKDLLNIKNEIDTQIQKLDDFWNEKLILSELLSFKEEYETQKRKIIPKNKWIRRLKQRQIHQEIKAIREQLEKKYEVSYQIILNNYNYICAYNVAALERIVILLKETLRI